MFRALGLLFLGAGLFIGPVSAKTFEAGPAKVGLLELYTSEGCSSCPPADAWLSGLEKRPGLWKDFVPAGFHVTDRDHLGWNDRLASPKHGERQRAYAAAWGNGRLYTPCVVFDGREWPDWANSDLPAPSGSAAGVLRVETEGLNRCEISFRPAAPAKGRLTAWIAVLGFGIGTDVEAGENAGRHLSHNFAVLDFVSAPMEEDWGGWRARAVFAVPPEIKTNRYALAVWVSPEGDPMPLQAAGAYIDD